MSKMVVWLIGFIIFLGCSFEPAQAQLFGGYYVSKKWVASLSVTLPSPRKGNTITWEVQVYLGHQCSESGHGTIVYHVPPKYNGALLAPISQGGIETLKCPSATLIIHFGPALAKASFSQPNRNRIVVTSSWDGGAWTGPYDRTSKKGGKRRLVLQEPNVRLEYTVKKHGQPTRTYIGTLGQIASKYAH